MQVLDCLDTAYGEDYNTFKDYMFPTAPIFVGDPDVCWPAAHRQFALSWMSISQKASQHVVMTNSDTPKAIVWQTANFLQVGSWQRLKQLIHGHIAHMLAIY